MGNWAVTGLSYLFCAENTLDCFVIGANKGNAAMDQGG
jgi:hypothetical protein